MGTAFTQMEADYKELCEFYGEETKTDPSELLGIFLKFSDSFEVRQEEGEVVEEACLLFCTRPL